MVFPEGRGSYRLHRQIERNPKLITIAKAQARQDGRLHCWVCRFDFAGKYGERGEGYIEAHHTIPISELGENEAKLDDIAMVCSNCHRMLHREPWLQMNQLAKLIAKR